MNTTALKVVIDTNIFITTIDKKSPFRWIFDAIMDGRIILCVSNSILLEYREILERKNGTEVAENILNFLSVYPYVEKYEIYYNLDLIPNDKDDNKFTDCSFASGGILISNDSHFNILSKVNFRTITHLTIGEFTQFWNEL
jgi:putative PIN family toxin of toxin-antitoxin system